MSGWVSRAFDCRQPAPTIAWRACLTGSSVLRTEILVHPVPQGSVFARDGVG
jgi:hypothetical protein